MPQNILIVGPAWVGDMIMAQSLVMALAQSRPGAAIDVLAPPWTVPLLQRMPEIRRAIAAPFAHGRLDLAARRRLGRELRAEAYDQAIVVPNSFKSALVPWFAGIPRRTGWRGEMRYLLLNDVRRPDRQAFPRTVERYAALAHDPAPRSAADMPVPPEPRLLVDSATALETRIRFGLSSERPVLALCPGAEYGPAKRWPERHFAALAAERIARGEQAWLLGSAKDAEVCTAIMEMLPAQARPDAHFLAGRTTLGEALDLLSLAHAVVSNDSGLMHAAAALGRPVAALYGPTPPGESPPLSPASRVLSLNLACSPCGKRVCPLGHHDCLEQLPPSLVEQALLSLETAP